MHRPKWADPFICGMFVLLMSWVAFDIYSSKGLDSFLVVPLFFAVTPCVFVFLLKQPLEVFLLFLIWLIACICFYAGMFEGETGFPGKNSDLSISFATSPAWFVAAMAINLAVIVSGIAGVVSILRRNRAL